MVMSKAVMEVMFIVKILLRIKTPVQLLVMVRVDNVGATFMVENVTVTSHTKHVDMRFTFVNEYVGNEIVGILFFKSTENDSNMFTNNLSGNLYEKCSKMIGEKHNLFSRIETELKMRGRVLEIMFYCQICS